MSSANALIFSSERRMKRLPSSRCASAIQIVRPSESMAEIQPTFKLALLTLSAMVSSTSSADALFHIIRYNGVATEIASGEPQTLVNSGVTQPHQPSLEGLASLHRRGL
jgi:hypothetical protein